MAVELTGSDGPRLAGVVVTIERGCVTACTSRLEQTTDAWALGSAHAWLEALVDANTDRIEPGGDGRLVDAVLGGLHDSLFDPQLSASS